MVKCRRVKKMGSRYQFREEEIAAIQEARRKNKDKRAEQRLKALELRAKGESAKAVSQATGFCAAYVSQLVKALSIYYNWRVLR